MEETIKEVKVYTVHGKEFIDKDEALKFEKEVERKLNYSFYIVDYSPDLNETGRFYNVIKIAVPKDSLGKLIVQQYMTKKHGGPVTYIQGSLPTSNWSIGYERTFDNLKDLKEFEDETRRSQFGSNFSSEIIYLNKKAEVVKKKNG